MPRTISKADLDRKEDLKKDKDYAECEIKHPLPRKVLFECGNPGSSITFTREGQSFTVASATIDTTCLCKPKVKVEFSSLVTFSIVEGTEFPYVVRLQFELIKACENGQEIACDTKMYERFIDGPPVVFDRPFSLIDTFSFISCECNTCIGCCDYSVRVTADTISTDTMENNVIAMVSNGRMSILASE